MGALRRRPRVPLDSQIFSVRGLRVISDADLAAAYGVSTGALNQAVKRNRARFPLDFAFQLSSADLAILKSQFVISSSEHGGRRSMPRVFTEHGAIMAASVLNSRRAIDMSVFVVRAFVRLREMSSQHQDFVAKLSTLEKKVCQHDESLREVFRALKSLLLPPTKNPPRIGYRP